MSDSASWYQRKLAAARGGAAGRPPQAAPPRQVTHPAYPPQQQLSLFNQPLPQQMPPVSVENLWGAMLQWKGGKAHRVDAEPCPECGSDKYYSRTEGARRGPPPAPHCFACGYNGLFTQGLQSTWSG